MNAAESKEEQCQNSLNKIYSDLLHLICSFEKGSGSELTVRLRQVESGLEQLREAILLIPDIQNNEQRQRDKNRLLVQESTSSVTEGSPNDQRLICGICNSVILLAGVGRWTNKEEVL
ncbi:hypothetical protein COOONC_26296, partial [Cooperia oncophora]